MVIRKKLLIFSETLELYHLLIHHFGAEYEVETYIHFQDTLFSFPEKRTEPGRLRKKSMRLIPEQTNIWHIHRQMKKF